MKNAQHKTSVLSTSQRMIPPKPKTSYAFSSRLWSRGCYTALMGAVLVLAGTKPGTATAAPLDYPIGTPEVRVCWLEFSDNRPKEDLPACEGEKEFKDEDITPDLKVTYCMTNEINQDICSEPVAIVKEGCEAINPADVKVGFDYKKIRNCVLYVDYIVKTFDEYGALAAGKQCSLVTDNAYFRSKYPTDLFYTSEASPGAIYDWVKASPGTPAQKNHYKTANHYDIENCRVKPPGGFYASGWVDVTRRTLWAIEGRHYTSQAQFDAAVSHLPNVISPPFFTFEVLRQTKILLNSKYQEDRGY